VYLYCGSTAICVSVMSTLCCYMLLFRRAELSCLDVLMVANGRKRAEASESCQLCYTTPGLACVPQRPAAAPAARLTPFVPFRPLSRPRASQAVPLHGSGCAYVLFHRRRHLASSPRGTLWMPCHALTGADAPATASGPAADDRRSDVRPFSIPSPPAPGAMETACPVPSGPPGPLDLTCSAGSSSPMGRFLPSFLHPGPRGKTEPRLCSPPPELPFPGTL
jgi:hypothetical protein